MGEGERVTPEEPLETDDRYTHHGQPDEGEGGLAAGEARVEEADAGNHEKDEGGGGDDPGKVTGLPIAYLSVAMIHFTECLCAF